MCRGYSRLRLRAWAKSAAAAFYGAEIPGDFCTAGGGEGEEWEEGEGVVGKGGEVGEGELGSGGGGGGYGRWGMIHLYVNVNLEC